MFIAEDLTEFKKRFVNSLKGMLSDDELGAFILVLANSQQDDFLQSSMRDSLVEKYAALQQKVDAGEIESTADDLAVFAQLQSYDLGNLPVWDKKDLGEWSVVLNTTRKLRPARNSAQKLSSIKQSFDDTKFHFDKAFLKPEILWEQKYNDLNVRVLFNKFPFSQYHLLFAVSPEEKQPQFLTQALHRYAMQMVSDVSVLLSGFAMAFNSLAGGASVNHLHFQGFVDSSELPVERERWAHNGGDKAYPLTVKKFFDVTTSWEYIDYLNNNDIAFNCIYRNESCYVVPRQYLGAVAVPEWLRGAGWLDVAGVVTVSDEKVFDGLTEDEVSDALHLLNV